MKALLLAALMLGVLSCGSPSAPGTGQPHNVTTAVTLSIGENSASQGDTVALAISFTEGDTPGDPLYFEISYDGSLPSIDTLTIPSFASTGDPTPVSLGGYLVIPGGLPDGQLTLTVILPDQGDTSRATLAVKDARAPFYIGDGSVVLPGRTPNAFVVNDFEPATPVINFLAGATDTVLFTVGDNHGVAWVGWAFGPPSNARDSVAVSGTVVQASLPMTVPASLVGTTPTFSVFVRDSDGNIAEDPFGAVTVASYVHHPVRTAPVDTAMNDIAYDAKRKVLYLSERGHSSVLVLSLTSMTFQTPIALPTAPAGLDLTPGGDTLVVALANTGDLAFVNLNGTPTTTVVQLASLDSVPGDSTTITSLARSVRVAADGHVLVGGFRSASGVESGALVDLNLATGRDTVVYPVVILGMTRSLDATRILVWGPGAIVYDGVAHQYNPTSTILQGPQTSMAMSADQTGASFLVGNSLYSAVGGAVSYLQDDNALTTEGYGSAVSDSGTTVWLGGATGGCKENGESVPCAASQPGFYFRLRVPGAGRDPGERLAEVADAPQGVVQLVALRGDSTLIGVGVNEIMAFDLTTSTPGSVAARVASHTPQPRAHITSVGGDSRLDFRVTWKKPLRSRMLHLSRARSSAG